jgi:rubrerythrin
MDGARPVSPRGDGTDHRRGRSWSLDDIPYAQIDRSVVGPDELLFDLIASASFIEIASETYTRNLVAFCAGDDEVVEWLQQGWQHEEVQHGTALRRYVETVWPDFDWERAYRRFIDEYDRLCSVELYAPTRALEMVARCVVETGTSSFYRMLADAAPEPVLRRLASFISRDEVDHYKHFYRYFRLYAERERPSRAAVLRTLMRRTGEVDAEDASIAFKHVRLARRPNIPYRSEEYAAFRRKVLPLARRHYRFDLAVKMLLKPLGLGGFASRVAVSLATFAARRFLFA